MKMTLEDTWSVSGSSLDGFKETVKEMALHTKHIRTTGDMLTILSDAAESGYAKDPEMTYLWELNNETLALFRRTGKLNPVKVKNTASITDSVTRSGMLIKFDLFGKTIPLGVSQMAITTMCTRAKVGGDKISQPSLGRDIDIAELLTSGDTEMTLVIRDDGENSKLFACMSAKYSPIPMTLLSDIADQLTSDAALGNAICTGWYVDHSITDCYIEFPEAGKDLAASYGLSVDVIPGVMLSSSDTGDSSVSIRGTYRVKGCRSFVTTEEVRVRHIGSATPAEVVKMVKEEIFKRLRSLPEALAEKIGLRITPASLDLKDPAGRKENFKCVKKAIKLGSKKLGVVKAIGKKREKELLECLYATIDESSVFTQYDIAMLYLTLGDKVAGLGRAATLKLSKALADAAFISYIDEPEEGDELYLVA